MTHFLVMVVSGTVFGALALFIYCLILIKDVKKARRSSETWQNVNAMTVENWQKQYTHLMERFTESQNKNLRVLRDLSECEDRVNQSERRYRDFLIKMDARFTELTSRFERGEAQHTRLFNEYRDLLGEYNELDNRARTLTLQKIEYNITANKLKDAQANIDQLVNRIKFIESEVVKLRRENKELRKVEEKLGKDCSNYAKVIEGLRQSQQRMQAKHRDFLTKLDKRVTITLKGIECISAEADKFKAKYEQALLVVDEGSAEAMALTKKCRALRTELFSAEASLRKSRGLEEYLRNCLQDFGRQLIQSRQDIRKLWSQYDKRVTNIRLQCEQLVKALARQTVKHREEMKKLEQSVIGYEVQCIWDGELKFSQPFFGVHCKESAINYATGVGKSGIAPEADIKIARVSRGSEECFFDREAQMVRSSRNGQ